MAREGWGAAIGAVSLVCAVGWTSPAAAQVNLPPPPPPPLSTSTPSPAPPPPSRPPPSRPAPSSPSSGSPSNGARPRPSSPPPHGHAAAREAPPPYEPAYAPSRRDLSLRLNPLPLALARISADVEILLASHHALVVSPHVTFAAHRGELPAEAFGFTADHSTGFGVEVGYHYWIRHDLQGFFLGPSLLAGRTSTPLLDARGQPRDVSNHFGFFGAAFDVGYQLVIASGFTIDLGGGAMLITGNSQTKAAPRVLLGVGWTF